MREMWLFTVIHMKEGSSGFGMKAKLRVVYHLANHREIYDRMTNQPTKPEQKKTQNNDNTKNPTQTKMPKTPKQTNNKTNWTKKRPKGQQSEFVWFLCGIITAGIPYLLLKDLANT